MTPPNQRLARSFLPRRGMLELTYRCSHRCSFCYNPWTDSGGSFDQREELTVLQWREAIATLCRLGCSSLGFSGGEPLLKEGVEDLLAFAAAQTVDHVVQDESGLRFEPGPPQLSLLTNGTEVTDDILRLCARHGISLVLSLPGLRTFCQHTGGKMPAQRVLEWFSEARRVGITTVASVAVTALNLPELRELLMAAFGAGAEFAVLGRFLPTGRGLAHADLLQLTDEQARAAFDIAEQVLKETDCWGQVGTLTPPCVVSSERYERLGLSARCVGGRRFFCVGPSGYLRVCMQSPKRLVHISRLDELPHDPYWRHFAFDRHYPEGCHGCEHTWECDAACPESAPARESRCATLVERGCGIACEGVPDANK